MHEAPCSVASGSFQPSHFVLQRESGSRKISQKRQSRVKYALEHKTALGHHPLRSSSNPSPRRVKAPRPSQPPHDPASSLVREQSGVGHPLWISEHSDCRRYLLRSWTGSCENFAGRSYRYHLRSCQDPASYILLVIFRSRNDRPADSQFAEDDFWLIVRTVPDPLCRPLVENRVIPRAWGRSEPTDRNRRSSSITSSRSKTPTLRNPVGTVDQL